MRGKNDAVARGNQVMALLITVAAGLVDGVTEATRPRARFQLKSGRCRRSAPAEETLNAWRAARLSDVFGKFISTRPMPVSLTASSAKSLACFRLPHEWQQWLTGALPRFLTLLGDFGCRNGVIQGRENAHLRTAADGVSLLCIFSSTAFTTVQYPVDS